MRFTSRRSWRIALTLSLLLVVVGLVFFLLLSSDFFGRHLAATLVAELEKRFQVEASIDEASLDPWALVIRLRNLELREKGDPTPAVRLDALRADLTWGTLLGNLGIERLSLTHPMLRIETDPEGGANLARMFLSRGAFIGATGSLQIGEILVEGGQIHLNKETLSVNRTRFGFKGDLRQGLTPDEFLGQFLLSDLELETRRLQLPPSQVEVTCQVKGLQVPQIDIRVAGKDARVDMQGEISSLIPFTYSFDLTAQAAFSAIRKPNFLVSVEQARFSADGRLTGEGREYMFRGRMTADEVLALDLVFEKVAAQVEMVREGVQFQDLEAELEGGQVHGQGHISLLDDGTSQVALVAEGVGLQRWQAALTGRADLSMDLAWPGTDWRSMTGKGRMEFQSKLALKQLQTPFGPFSGTSPVVFKELTAFLDGSATSANSEVEFKAQLVLGGGYSAQVGVRADQPDKFFKPLMETAGDWRRQARLALKKSRFINLDIDLNKAADGATNASSRVDPFNFEWMGVALGRLEGRLEWSGDDKILVRDLRLKGPRVDARGIIDIPLAPSPGVRWQVEADLNRVPVDLLRAPFDLDQRPNGVISGDLTAQRSEDGRLQGQGHLRIMQPSWDGHVLDTLEGDLALTEQSLELKNIRGLLGSGSIEGSADWKFQQRFIRGHLRAKDIPLRRLKDSTSTGRLSFTVQASGPLSGLDFEASLKAEQATIRGIEIVRADIQAQGRHGTADFQADIRTLGGHLTGQGRTALGSDMQSSADFSFQSLPLAPTVSLFAPALVQGMEGSTDGTIHLEGPLADINRLALSTTLARFEIKDVQSGYVLAASKPIKTSLEQGQLKLDQVELKGQDGDLSVRGAVGLGDRRDLQLEIDGHAGLTLLSRLTPGRYWGDLTLNTRISGDWDKPRIVGSAALTKAFLSNPDLPITLFDAEGEFKFTPDQVSVDRFTARTEYGRIEAQGGIFLKGFLPDAYQLNIFGKRLNVDFPQDFRSLVDVNLTLLRSSRSRLVTGRVTVLSSEYDKDVSLVDLVTEYLNRNDGAVFESDADEAFDLDIHVSGYRTIRVHNNLADILASADLNLRGDWTSPVILGSLNVDEGKLFLEGNDYDINRGIVNFKDLRRTVPNLSFEAETTIRDFTVTTEIHGPIDRLSMDFRSDPPMPTADIVSLLAVGQTVRELGGPNGGDLGIIGAGRVLSRALQSDLETQTNRLFGLQKFSVDPFLSGGGRDPGARITVGRRLGRYVDVTYVTDISNEDSGDIVIVEVQLRPWLTAVGTREQDGSLALDFKLKKRF